MHVCVLWLLGGVAFGGSLTTNRFGESLHWESDYVSYGLNPSGKHGLSHDAIEETVLEAAAQWEGIEGSWLQFGYEGQTDIDTYDNEDGAQVIFFVDEWDPSQNPDLLALTYVWSFDDGSISHFDMAINADGHEWSTDGDPDKNDLLNALVHEFGHVSGLDHSSDEEATMFFQTSVGELIKRDLSEDDIVTYASLYGGSYPYGDTGYGCSTAGTSAGSIGSVSASGGGAYPSFNGPTGCATFGGGGHLLALFAGLMAVQRRRRS